MRIQVLFASAAVLAACGGSTSPVTSAAPSDAGSDVAIDHISGQGEPAASSSEKNVAPPAKVVKHAGRINPSVGGSSSSSSGGSGSSSGGGSDASMGGSFSCGTGGTSSMCMAPGQYCSITMTGGNNTEANCQPVPFSCTSGATCACVQQFDGGLPGCSCADDGGKVTVTCRY